VKRKSNSNQPDKMKQRVFVQALRTKEFITTKQAVTLLRRKQFWTDDDIADIIQAGLENQVCRMMRKIKDGRGRPVFANVLITDEDGEQTQGYMQQELFDVEHYNQTIKFHEDRARHHIVEANEYAKDLKNRYTVQYELAFPMPDAEDEEAA
jgi:hypothetical protein